MKEKFYRFMQGRYGQYGQDQLSRFLLYAMLACAVLNLLFRSEFLYLLVWVLAVYGLFRLFSKNYNARYGENQKFLQATAKFRYWFDRQKGLAEERKYHRIYTCPKCRQKIRIPKGKGKIMVRCPKCQYEFQKRS